MTVALLNDADTYRGLMLDLTSVLVRDINAEFQRVNHYDRDKQQAWMTSAYPEVWVPKASAASDLALNWYQSAAPEVAYGAVRLLMPKPETIAGQVAWAFAEHAIQHALLAAAQRDMWGEFRRTIAVNADREEGARWARHASANACRWCQMLSTRGPVYASKKAASVDGDSGFLGGFKERYHKHCKCMAVPVRPGRTYEPPPYVDEWTADYERAAQLAGGSRNAKAVMAAYRQMDKENS
ncbi:VG15 protein [Nocardia gipuzkoensis]